MTAPEPVLVVGAGLAGAVYARRLAEHGYRVRVIDRRAHIAGNAYDAVDENGVRVHRYGPHLFHTANRRVLAYVRSFCAWVPYTHRVRALLPSGQLAPLPINLDTMNAVFGTHLATAQEAQAYLRARAVPRPAPANAAAYLEARIGRELTALFFRPYTRKMWGLDLEDLEAGVVKRLPLRFDRLDTYFEAHQTQLMPRAGYTHFVGEILRHPGITLALSTPFEPAMMREVGHCFASMSIDEYYGYRAGVLPYRSIRFHARSVAADRPGAPWDASDDASFSVINFTDDGPFTRETAWARLPGHLVRETGRRTLTREEPCDFRDNAWERYYPIVARDGAPAALYARYAAMARAEAARVTFIGRCGTYRYLDMDGVINQSLAGADRWLAARGAACRPPASDEPAPPDRDA